MINTLIILSALATFMIIFGSVMHNKDINTADWIAISITGLMLLAFALFFFIIIAFFDIV
jgi:hypothetical protein